MKSRRVFALALSALAFVFAPAASQAQASQQVTTIAGSGAAGLADGPAAKATFLFPFGIAVSPDGSIYISDRAAQRIRMLSPSGEVRTVAGSGPIVAPGLVVQPGYADGPALLARFASPEGLAVGPEGALYIADSRNYCIRKLLRGEVTTFAGACDHAGTADGDRSAARFGHPKSLAFDGAGDMYVADDGVGLRKVDKDGLVTTIPFKSDRSLSALGVTVVEGGEPLVLTTTLDGIVAYHPATKMDERYSGYTLELPTGAPNQIAALDPRQFVLTDAMSHNIRYFRLPESGPGGKPFTGVLAGGDQERGIDNAGFAGGTFGAARFYDPMGVAVAGNKILIADGGNRRIREIVIPDRQNLPALPERL